MDRTRAIHLNGRNRGSRSSRTPPKEDPAAVEVRRCPEHRSDILWTRYTMARGTRTFLSVLKTVSPERRRIVLVREIGFAYLVVVAFLLAGDYLPRVL